MLTEARLRSRPARLYERAAREEDNRQRLRLGERQYYRLCKSTRGSTGLAGGDYGYCREIGEPIGIERLRPTAELCIEAKTRAGLLERNVAKARR